MHRPSFHEYHTSASKKSSKMSRSFGSDGSAPEGSTAPVETDPLMVKLDDSDDEDKEGNNQSLLQEFADEVLDPNDTLVVTGRPKDDLVTWCSFDMPDPPFEYTVSGVKLCDAYTYLALLGGPEKVSFMVSEYEVDADGDGNITEEEMQEKEEHCLRLVEQALNFLINSGVVGALLLSVLFPQVLIPLVPSDDSLQFFGDSYIMGFYYTYVFFMYFGLFCSIWITFMTIHYYLHITIWMPTTELKMWYVTELNVLPGVVFLTHACVVASAIALPFGICVGISSEAAFIAAAGCLVMFGYILGGLFSTEGGDAVVIRELHKRTRQMLIKDGHIVDHEGNVDTKKEGVEDVPDVKKTK